MATIVVTDADSRAALAVVRSLGRAGHQVHTTATRRGGVAAASRWTRSDHRVPDPVAHPKEFAAAHAELVRRVAANVLIPIAEKSALALLDSPPPGVSIPMPDIHTFRRVCDKVDVLATATALGIRVPRQVILRSAEDLDHLTGELPLPAAVKASRSVSGAQHHVAAQLVVRYANSTEELRRAVGAFHATDFPLLVQERIAGAGVGVFLLLWEGSAIAASGHRRLREKPPSGGVSTYRESITPPPALRAASLTLLHTLGFRSGVAMVEFKHDTASNEFVLMEINGRFWGSLQLAIDAGVDFPAYLVALALGDTPEPRPSRDGGRSRWFWGDVDHLIARARRNLDAQGRPLRGSRARALVSAFSDVFLRRDAMRREEVWRRDDPWPFVAETYNWLRAR